MLLSIENIMAFERILFVSADPGNMQRLRLADEQRDITEALSLAQRGVEPIKSIGAARTNDLQQALLNFKPQIVHFSGHGVGESGLVFQDLVGRGQLVNAAALANLFRLFSRFGLECVILNACYSSIQAEEIAKGISFVVGMSDDIADSAARKFSTGFYQAIGAGEPIEFAYEFGCAAIQMENIPEYLTPVLFKNGEQISPDPNLVKEAINEPPTISPIGTEGITPSILEACESAYPNEDIRLIEWNMTDNGDFFTLFRERRRGWYFQMTLSEKKPGKWGSTNRVCPFFLPLLQQDEYAWHELTEPAPPGSWLALDEIIRLGLKFPESKIHLVNQFTIGEEVLDESMEQFGIYVPEEHLLPAFLFVNKKLGLLLISYFRHPDGFAKENMVCDDKTDECQVFDSLQEAQQSLKEKLER